MPETAQKIFTQLNSSERSMEELEIFGLYESGSSVVKKPEILFARLDMKEVIEKVDAMYESRKAPISQEEEADEIEVELQPEISFEDFGKMQFAVGEIISCEEVKKSRKLLCSQVKIGNQVKQIVSGIKGHYTPEEMKGKKVMVLLNLKPAKLAGVLSEGMLLCAEDPEGNLSLMVPEKDMPAGASIS
jgi:methionyl-tRNA synthetase